MRLTLIAAVRAPNLEILVIQPRRDVAIFLDSPIAVSPDAATWAPRRLQVGRRLRHTHVRAPWTTAAPAY